MYESKVLKLNYIKFALCNLLLFINTWIGKLRGKLLSKIL